VSRETFDSWIPVQLGDDAIQALNRGSVIERVGRPEPMVSDTKNVPRSGVFAVAAVAKGGTYTETSGTNDYVQLIARKAGGAIRMAEEDISTDSPVDIIQTKKNDAARNMGYFFDNGTIGVSAAENGTTVPWTSIYKSVRTTDANVSYTADNNYVSGSATYVNLSSTLAKVEDSIWFDEEQIFIVASPVFKQRFREIVDNNGRPIFFDGGGATPSTLFGYEVNFTVAARVSATATYAPTGNPLLVIGNRDLAIKGMAKLSPHIASPNPGFAIQRADNGIGFLTDEALMKAAMRRAFKVGAANAFAVFEKTS
jgi:hypothetical protein